MTEPTDPLLAELHAHMDEPFPDSVEKGEAYGQVDAVMIGADICGWAGRATSLSPREVAGLRLAAEQLRRSLGAFPNEARPYYERVLRIADLALDRV